MESMPMSGVIEYTSAGAIARLYDTVRQKLTEAEKLLNEASSVMKEADFEHLSDNRGFAIVVQYSPNKYDVAQRAIDEIKVNAWKSVIQKTGIQKFMSSKRKAELSKLLHGKPEESAGHLPELTEESVTATVQGYAMSLDEFLQEAVEEEYDYWKAVSQWDQKKTNQKMRFSGKLESKVIKHYAVDTAWRLSLREDTRRHLTSLESIMSLLDGKGMPKAYSTPVVASIDGGIFEGSSEYFKYKCFKNCNMHLQFLRLDLLEKFNKIAGRNRLAQPQNAE
jgi:hypothetical protein